MAWSDLVMSCQAQAHFGWFPLVSCCFMYEDCHNLDVELCQMRSLPVLCYGCPLQTWAHMSSDAEQGVKEKQHCPVMM